MNNLFKRGALSAQFRLSRHMALAIAALALGLVGLRGRTQPVSTTTDKPGLAMKQFVFYFDKVPRGSPGLSRNGAAGRFGRGRCGKTAVVGNLARGYWAGRTTGSARTARAARSGRPAMDR